MISVAMETILVGNLEVLSYQNICNYKMAWRSLNTLCTPTYGTPLDWAGHQLSDEGCGIYICVILRKIFEDMCVKCRLLLTL